MSTESRISSEHYQIWPIISPLKKKEKQDIKLIFQSPTSAQRPHARQSWGVVQQELIRGPPVSEPWGTTCFLKLLHSVTVDWGEVT